MPLLDVPTGAAALLDTGSKSSVNTCIYDQARYCLSAVYVEVTEDPVLRSGRSYSYLLFTDSDLTGHLNNDHKIQNTASSFFPLVNCFFQAFLCPDLFHHPQGNNQCSQSTEGAIPLG